VFWGFVLVAPAMIGIPVACAVAVLKHRLYEIDRLISRTVAYAIVTGLLVGVYAALVLLATRVLPLSGSVAVAGIHAGRGGAVQPAAVAGAAGDRPPFQPDPV
jgi:hypothetical protein